MLYIVATPIGNLNDLSPRALEALRSAHVVACEDTRRTRTLLCHFGIPYPERMISYREGNERAVGPSLIAAAQQGRNVALCSDSGCPALCDPGYRLIQLAIEQNVPFEVLPGASAIPLALLYSGLPTSSFTFKGFPPRKPGALHRFFEEEALAAHTLVLFESPFRVSASLTAALKALGNRKAAVCLELTKKFERISRGYLKDLCEEYAGRKIRGEVTIVIAGNNPKFHDPLPFQYSPEDGEDVNDSETDINTPPDDQETPACDQDPTPEENV